MLLADGFEDALIGVMKRKMQPDVACYDYGQCVQILIDRDHCTLQEAHEHMAFNVLDAYVGEETPSFLIRAPSDMEPLEFLTHWSEDGF